jgi:hypothetical protein
MNGALPRPVYLTRVIILDRPWQPYPLAAQLETITAIRIMNAISGIEKSMSRCGFITYYLR